MFTGILSALIVPAILLALAYFSYRVVLFAKKGLPWQRKRKSPFTIQFLRAPGHSVYEKVEDLRLDLMGYMLGVTVFPVLLLAMHYIAKDVSDKPRTTVDALVLLVIGIGVVLHQLIRLYRTTRELKMMRLGYEAEVAVGQELNQLMHLGFHVYHDFPGQGFNIDHVVIGSTGVFSVETKGRSKPVTGDGKADSKVIVDGEILRFPDWQERQPIPQARIQAAWLGRWLASAVGEPVAVVPVLTIPGWYTEIKKPGDVKFFFGRQPEKLFSVPHQHPVLSDAMIARIVHQVDARCRDVESKAYVPMPSKMAKQSS